MPDPQLALPVRVVKRAGRFVVVDAVGKRVSGGGAFGDEGQATGVADQINKAWDAAKSERKAKGAPPVTREARIERRTKLFAELLEGEQLEELAFPHLGPPPLRLHFDPRLHPRGRHGQFSEVLGKLARNSFGSRVDLPHGVHVRRETVGFGVHHEGGVEHYRLPTAAAAHALGLVDRGELAHGADPEHLFRQHIEELEQARHAAMAAAALHDQDKLERAMRVERRTQGVRQRLASAGSPSLHRGRSRRTATSSIPLYARNRPAGHPLRGARSPAREERVAHMKEVFGKGRHPDAPLLRTHRRPAANR